MNWNVKRQCDNLWACLMFISGLGHWRCGNQRHIGHCCFRLSRIHWRSRRSGTFSKHFTVWFAFTRRQNVFGDTEVCAKVVSIPVSNTRFCAVFEENQLWSSVIIWPTDRPTALRVDLNWPMRCSLTVFKDDEGVFSIEMSRTQSSDRKIDSIFEIDRNKRLIFSYWRIARDTRDHFSLLLIATHSLFKVISFAATRIDVSLARHSLQPQCVFNKINKLFCENRIH